MESKKTKAPAAGPIAYALVFLLPLTLFLSNFPLIKLGETSSMHLELTLPELWLVAFFFANLKNLAARYVTLILSLYHRSFKKSSLPLLIATLGALYATISVFWSPNKPRALLTAGLIWLTLFAIINLIDLLKRATKTQKQKLETIFFATSVVIAVFCWLQCVLNLAGNNLLLCAGCTYATFGFPHPNGFAIEPQFMGGLLLAPALFALWRTTKTPTKRNFILAFFLSATLFLTFSRGAIYAFLLAIILMLILSKKIKPLVIAVLAFLITLCAQGTMAQLSPTSDTFTTGATKVIHHLTLGHLDLRPNQTSQTDQSAQTTQLEPTPTDPDTSKPDSAFSGYVAASTDIRVGLTTAALKLWSKTPKNLLIGTGLGSAGTVLSAEDPETVTSPKEIVQNQYASLLLELGLTAYAILGVGVCVQTRQSYKNSRCAQLASEPKRLAPVKTGGENAPRIFIICLVCAYCATLFFFSGLGNALYIYLFPPLLFALSSPSPVARKSSSATHPLAQPS